MLGYGLQRNFTLATLKLACCVKITDHGVKALAKALETNSALSRLDFSYCVKVGVVVDG